MDGGRPSVPPPMGHDWEASMANNDSFAWSLLLVFCRCANVSPVCRHASLRAHHLTWALQFRMSKKPLFASGWAAVAQRAAALVPTAIGAKSLQDPVSLVEGLPHSHMAGYATWFVSLR
eukprot:3976778-Amphidinium_carterae.1